MNNNNNSKIYLNNEYAGRLEQAEDKDYFTPLNTLDVPLTETPVLRHLAEKAVELNFLKHF